MIPFLKRNKEASVSAPVDTIKRDPDEDKQEEDVDGLEVAAQDILSAIKSNNAKDLAVAIKAAFELCDSEPHVEGEQIIRKQPNVI